MAGAVAAAPSFAATWQNVEGNCPQRPGQAVQIHTQGGALCDRGESTSMTVQIQRRPSRNASCRQATTWQCSSLLQERETTHQALVTRNVPRQTVRLALPSKGRMAEDTLELLKACQLTIYRPNPRQYIASVREMESLEVWFQRASDVVRKLRSGDVDLGIVGYDMLKEYGQDDEDLVIVHDSLGFGTCHLAIAVPSYGIFEKVNTLDQLMAMPQWTEEQPLRIITGYTHLGKKFLEANNMKPVTISTADGALEAAPAMGTADAILDLVSSGTTLRENNLKELKGARVLESQGVLVASRRALLERKGTLGATHEMLERLEAHLRAKDRFMVTANMRGSSEEDVAQKIWEKTENPGLQGPTISRVYTKSPEKENGVEVNYYSVVVVVPKSRLYDSIRELRAAGGSGVLVSPLTYIFDEEPPRWRQLLDHLGLEGNGY